jgi:hypothetical protein
MVFRHYGSFHAVFLQPDYKNGLDHGRYCHPGRQFTFSFSAKRLALKYSREIFFIELIARHCRSMSAIHLTQ